MPKTGLQLRLLQTVQHVGEGEAVGNPSASGRRGESERRGGCSHHRCFSVWLSGNDKGLQSQKQVSQVLTLSRECNWPEPQFPPSVKWGEKWLAVRFRGRLNDATYKLLRTCLRPGRCWLLSATSPSLHGLWHGVPCWQRTNTNSLLHTLTSRRRARGHRRRVNCPLWPCQLTCSLLQSRREKESPGSGRNWIQHWERRLRRFRNWIENVSRHFAKPFLLPCCWTRQPADSLRRTGVFVEGAPHPPKELRLTEQRTGLDTCLRAKSLSPFESLSSVWVA